MIIMKYWAKIYFYKIKLAYDIFSNRNNNNYSNDYIYNINSKEGLAAVRGGETLG